MKKTVTHRKAVAFLLVVSCLFLTRQTFAQCTTPVAPTATGATRTGAGTVTLTASGSSGSYYWYDAATAGTKLFTGTSYTTPSINMTTIYYVSAYSGTCESLTRTAVTAIVTYPQAWQLNTNGKDVFYGQKVGIGVVSPSESLEVKGNIKSTSLSGKQYIMTTNDEEFSYLDNYSSTIPGTDFLGFLKGGLILNSKSQKAIVASGKFAAVNDFFTFKNTFLSCPFPFSYPSKTLIGVPNNEDVTNLDMLTVRGGNARIGPTSGTYIRLGYDGTNSFINAIGSGSLMINNNIGKKVFIGTGTSLSDVEMGGNVSIGSSANQNGAKFQIAKESTFKIYANGGGDITSSTSIRPHFASNTDFKIYEGPWGGATFRFGIFGNGNTFLAPSGGAVAIGTTNTTSMTGYMLTVNGAIRAKEIKVNTNWSDFVFDSNYKLMPLAEVEAFIQDHGHLPEIPSAKEVEENGVSLGEMQARLLQKIEELILHVIELKKENEKMKVQNVTMSQQIELLQKK